MDPERGFDCLIPCFFYWLRSEHSPPPPPAWAHSGEGCHTGFGWGEKHCLLHSLRHPNAPLRAPLRASAAISVPTTVTR